LPRSTVLLNAVSVGLSFPDARLFRRLVTEELDDAEPALQPVRADLERRRQAR
jgi:hypothetical protein